MPSVATLLAIVSRMTKIAAKKSAKSWQIFIKLGENRSNHGYSVLLKSLFWLHGGCKAIKLV